MKKGKSINVKISFKLKDAEREAIRILLSKGKESVRVIKRAQVLNLFDQGYTSPGIAKAVSMNAVTVRKIGWRYLDGGLTRALYDLPRPGNERLLSEKQASQIIALVCSDAPDVGRNFLRQRLDHHFVLRQASHHHHRRTGTWTAPFNHIQPGRYDAERCPQ